MRIGVKKQLFWIKNIFRIKKKYSGSKKQYGKNRKEGRQEGRKEGSRKEGSKEGVAFLTFVFSTSWLLGFFALASVAFVFFLFALCGFLAVCCNYCGKQRVHINSDEKKDTHI